MEMTSPPKITVFHCVNSITETRTTPSAGPGACELKFIPLACSSMVKDVFLLRAFEAGADAVVVLVCPEGACRYVEGNLRAKKRVQWVKDLLDEIGMDGRRLALFNLRAGDGVGDVLDQTLDVLRQIQPTVSTTTL
ncbi:MAG: hydrogenase iron-sulfur subunit [Pseudomonadota bacterium]